MISTAVFWGSGPLYGEVKEVCRRRRRKKKSPKNSDLHCGGRLVLFLQTAPLRWLPIQLGSGNLDDGLGARQAWGGEGRSGGAGGDAAGRTQKLTSLAGRRSEGPLILALKASKLIVIIPEGEFGLVDGMILEVSGVELVFLEGGATLRGKEAEGAGSLALTCKRVLR